MKTTTHHGVPVITYRFTETRPDGQVPIPKQAHPSLQMTYGKQLIE